MRKLVFVGLFVALVNHLVDPAEGAGSQSHEASPDEGDEDLIYAVRNDDKNSKHEDFITVETSALPAHTAGDSTSGAGESEHPMRQKQEVDLAVEQSNGNEASTKNSAEGGEGKHPMRQKEEADVAVEQSIGDEAFTEDSAEDEQPEAEQEPPIPTELKQKIKKMRRAGNRVLRALAYLMLLSAADSLFWMFACGNAKAKFLNRKKGSFEDTRKEMARLFHRHVAGRWVEGPVLILAILYFYVRIRLIERVVRFLYALAQVLAWRLKQWAHSKLTPNQALAAEAADEAPVDQDPDLSAHSSE